MARITNEIKIETKENIINAATELFATHGFDKTKTKTIAQLCHIAEGPLFNYFPTKDDLLIAVFEHMAKKSDESQYDNLPRPIDIIMATILEPIRQMNKIPKGFLLDLLISSIKIAKKKPKIFHKLTELDFNYIEQLKIKLDIYGEFENHSISSLDLAEMIYGVVATDFILYLYTKEYTYETFEVKAKTKLQALINPYLSEVNKHD